MSPSASLAAPPEASSAAAAPAVCAHCGLPVPAGLIDDGAADQFCCHGCRTVFELLHRCGLDEYYRLREPAGPATRASGRSFAAFDDAVFQQRCCRDAEGGLRRVELQLEGVHCAACVWLVERLPRAAPGVVEARLDFQRRLVQVTWDPQRIALSRAAAALDGLGYPPHAARDTGVRRVRQLEDRRALVRIGIAGACAGNVMMHAFSLYGGEFAWIEPEHAALFRWTSAALGAVALCWPGAVFFRGAWAALRTRTAHLDIPIALALLVGGVSGLVNAVRGAGEIYFDSLTMLVFLLLVGRWIQLRQQRWAADSVELLYALTPGVAHRVEGDAVRDVPIEALIPGECVEVRAAETTPVDGVVESGESMFDHALLSGESQPVRAAVSERVYAGTINLSAPVRVRVEAAGRETRVGRLMALVEAASRSRPPLVLFANRISGWFTLAVVTAALATLAAWWTISPARAINNAAALLIVACPCALGLATPLAFTAAIGRAARRGILIKTGDALEALARRGAAFVDKTGTLTAGRAALVRWIGDDESLRLASALERCTSHPFAAALAAAAPGADAARVEGVTHTLGGGVAGVVDGRAVLVGSPAFVHARLNINASAAMDDSIAGLVDAGLSPVLVSVDGRLSTAGVGDPLRPDSAAAVEKLAAMGWPATLLSGDHPDVVAAVARSLGSAMCAPPAALGGISPEAKAERVARSAAAVPTLMIGDGVNDAAALAAATVGVSVHGGAEASLAAADVYLSTPGLGGVVDLVRAARRTVAAVRWSFAVSLLYNLTAAGMAAGGQISPLIAAVLMPLSSFSVLAIVFGVRTFDTTTDHAGPGHDRAAGREPSAA